MTGDIVSEDNLEEFPKGINGCSDMKELATVISKKGFSFVWKLIFLIGTKLSEVAVKDYNSGKEKLGSELINASMSLISLGRKMQKNIPSVLKNKNPKESSGVANDYFDVEELAISISKMSYNSIGKFLFFLGIELSRMILEKNHTNKEEDLDVKLLDICNSLENVGNIFVTKIWNDICKKHSKEV